MVGPFACGHSELYCAGDPGAQWLHDAVRLVERRCDPLRDARRSTAVPRQHTRRYSIQGERGREKVQQQKSSTPTSPSLFQVINWQTTLCIPQQAQLTRESADLILKLCCGADRRLGKNADEVKAHPFFKSIDFGKNLRTQKAPYIPKIEHPTDTSNFDPVDPDKLHNSADSVRSDDFMDTGKPHHGFFEFTFRRFFDDNNLNKQYIDTSSMTGTGSAAGTLSSAVTGVSAAAVPAGGGSGGGGGGGTSGGSGGQQGDAADQGPVYV